MNLQYFVPAAFPLPRTKLRNVYDMNEEFTFSYGLSEDQIFKSVCNLLGKMQEMCFSATHIQTTACFINFNRSVDASKTFTQKDTS